MIRNLGELITNLEETTGFPVFAEDIRQDEIENNPSFFVYVQNGEIEKSPQGVESFLVKFYLSFITSENKKINQFEIIKMFDRHGLFFERTDVVGGKLQKLDKEASMTTFICHHIERGRC